MTRTSQLPSPSPHCGGKRRTTAAKTVTSVAAIAGAIVLGSLSLSGPAEAATAPVGLGVVGAYSVLGGQTVTNTGPSILNGNLGVSPGSAITGFPPGLLLPPAVQHAADAPALQAQAALVTAYNDAAGRPVSANVAADLAGRTLVAGVYRATGPLGLTGTVTLDGQGDQNSVFIFQIPSTLITASSSHVLVLNGAQACHVYWQVGSSATLGTASDFKGTVLALTSIAVQTAATVQGRTLARNGAVTLDNNVFSTPSCTTTTPTAGPTTTAAKPPTRGASTPAVPTTIAVAGPGHGAGAASSSTAPAGNTQTGTGTGVGIGSTPTNGTGSQLASTGTSSLRPLIGLGTALSLSGLALLTVGNRRRNDRTPRHAA